MENSPRDGNTRPPDLPPEKFVRRSGSNSYNWTWNNNWFQIGKGVHQFSSVQFSCSVLSDSATPWTAAHQASLSITNSWSLLKLMSIELVMPSNHFILFRPSLLLRSILPSIRVFSNESVLRIRWSKYWSFSFSISPSNVYSGLISFRMDWFDLLAVQGTLKSLFQHHSSKASVLLCSAFFVVQCSHPYMTTGKTIALSRQTFAGKVMSLLFNMLSSLVLTFLPRNKRLLNLWLQSPSAAILVHPPKKKVFHQTWAIPGVSPSCPDQCLWSLSNKLSLSYPNLSVLSHFYY